MKQDVILYRFIVIYDIRGREFINVDSVVITVVEPSEENNPPVARDDSVATAYNTSILIDVLANDTDS